MQRPSPSQDSEVQASPSSQATTHGSAVSPVVPVCATGPVSPVATGAAVSAVGGPVVVVVVVVAESSGEDPLSRTGGSGDGHPTSQPTNTTRTPESHDAPSAPGRRAVRGPGGRAGGAIRPHVPFAHAGEICALLAPLCWAVAVILYRQTHGVTPLSMNLFKNALAIVLLTVTLLALGIRLPTDRPLGEWLRLATSGIVGLAVADTLLFEGLRRVGAARVAVVDTIYAPLMIVMAWLFLGEQPGAAFLVGGAAVIVGVAVATIDLQGASARGDRPVVVGMIYTFGAIFGTAVGVILSKPVLEHSDLIEVTWTRLVAGNVALAVWITVRGQWAEAGIAFRPSIAWKTLVPGAIVGTYLSLVFWLGGFKWADASVAAVLNQMATIYILVLARLVLGETIVPRQVLGAGFAVAGALVIMLTR